MRRKYYRVTPNYNHRGHWQVWERRGLVWRWQVSTPYFSDLVSTVKHGEGWLQKAHHKIVWVPAKGDQA